MRSSSRLLARVAAPRLGPAAFVGSSSRSIYSVPYSELSVGVPKESASMEKRVGQTPESVAKLVKEGITVKVEAGAGAAADFSDAAYEKAGASVVSRDEAWGASLVTKVPSLLLPSLLPPVSNAAAHRTDVHAAAASPRCCPRFDMPHHPPSPPPPAAALEVMPPTEEEAKLVGDRMLLSFVFPAQNDALVKQLQAQKATVFAMDCIPRTLSRGQAFDALSSQANIAGYRAVIEASGVFGRFFAGQMTAAGKVPPAKVMVLGGGVAGLAAVQTAKNMGAIVKLFDVRAAVEEQAKSMGAEFLKVDFEESGEGGGGYAKEMSAEWHAAAREMLTKQCEDVDIVITTALIPGKKAPVMVTEEMVGKMKAGSVTVDLAASAGGNVETTVRDARRGRLAPPASVRTRGR